MSDLRERLIAAIRKEIDASGTTGIMPYPDVVQRGAEIEADRALAVLVAWLRDEATGIKERADSAESLTGRTVLIVQAEVLERLADSITGDTDG